MRANNILCVGILVTAVFLSGCDKSVSPHLLAKKHETVPGVTDDEILIGTSLALSGHAGLQGQSLYKGALAYFEEVNANGGVQGRTIRLISYDDAYDPARCIYNTQRLLGEDQVFALFSYLGTPTGKKARPIAERYQVPLIGMMSGATVLREPKPRMVFHIRPSYADEIDSAFRHFEEDLNLRDVALFYQNDSFGFDGLQLVQQAAARYGLRLVASGSYRRGSEDIAPALERIRSSSAEAVVIMGLYTPSAKFIAHAQREGFEPLFYAVSFVGPESLADELTRFGYQPKPDRFIVVSQVVPPPDNRHLSAPREFRSLMAKYFPETPLTFAGLEGYLNAKVLVEGLRRAGERINRSSLTSALESIWDMEVGVGQPIGYGPDDHIGLSHVYFNRYENGRWSFFTNWQPLAERP